MQDGADGRESQDRPRGDALAAREQYRALQEKAPKAEDVQVLIWEILTLPQKQHVEAEIQAFRDQEEMRRAERYVQERLKNREGAPQPEPRSQAATPRRPGAGGDQRISPERRERLMRLFSSLSPEQQEQLLQRLEARMREEGAAAAPRGRRGQPDRDAGSDKPAPKTEDVDVPDMSEMSGNG